MGNVGEAPSSCLWPGPALAGQLLFPVSFFCNSNFQKDKLKTKQKQKRVSSQNGRAHVHTGYLITAVCDSYSSQEVGERAGA